MKRKKTLLIICALGYATSTMIKKTICDCFETNCIDGWNVECIGYNMSQGRTDDADIIVTSLDLNPKEYTVPVIRGVALISGIGKEKVLNQIVEEVRRIEQNQ